MERDGRGELCVVTKQLSDSQSPVGSNKGFQVEVVWLLRRQGDLGICPAQGKLRDAERPLLQQQAIDAEVAAGT